MTLGNAAIAKVRLIVCCKAGGHQVEPGPAELARTYGPDVAVPDWHARLMCSRCGSRDIRPQGMAKQDKSASLSRTRLRLKRITRLLTPPPPVGARGATPRPSQILYGAPMVRETGPGVVRDDYREAAPAPRWR
jgi:hypothetical protein